jgi:hypothetical protein
MGGSSIAGTCVTDKKKNSMTGSSAILDFSKSESRRRYEINRIHEIERDVTRSEACTVFHFIEVLRWNSSLRFEIANNTR